MPRRRGAGSILILVFVLMVTLILSVQGLIFLVVHEARDVGSQANDYRVLALADAGLERAIREIRDDYLTSAQTGTADLRGSNTTGSVSIGSATNMYLINNIAATINADSDIAILRRFDTNYTQTRIISVYLYARASRTSSGTGAQMTVSYTTDGINYTTAITTNVAPFPSLTTSFQNFSADITGSLTWPTMMNTNLNFRLRAQRTPGSGTSTVNIDAMWLRVTYEIDTNTEDWATGSYSSFPIVLGDGNIETVTITDESSKVHLNYAPQRLLRYLMQERGIASSTANTMATRIVSYRGTTLTNPFDSVEELQRVTGMTQSIYDAIEDYVTVYSYINPYSYNPSATAAVSRAPININTASREVLEAIFDPMGLAAADVPRLAGDIISQRNTAPFRCYYDYFALASDMTVFTNFINSAARTVYLNSTERARILGNADSSFLITGTTYTTEFCYATTAFDVQSIGSSKGVEFTVTTKVKDDPRDTGNIRTFYNYTGDTSAVGYRRENW